DIRTLLGKAAVQHMVRAMRQALKISNEESDEMQGTMEGIAPLLADERPRVATMKRFLATPTAGQSRALMEAMARVGIQGERIGWLRDQLKELEKTEYAPKPLITGDDLTAAGLEPGPVFRRVLEAVYDAQLEGRVGSREEALKMGVEIAGGRDGTKGTKARRHEGT
ncbi:MAG: hypothetical protein ACM359_01820, partial [Bacillota bacterium]